ncbi:MAG TPA: ATP-binding protein [Solirubrobacter sp.]|nr:ATP-binding protein [Solirubrobacter sp.]
MPLRAYLAGLVALFVIAAGAAVVYGRVQSRNDARAAAEADARFAARLAAREIGNGLASVQQTVVGAASNPGIQEVFSRPQECTLNFAGTDAYTTGHIDVIGQDGKLVCSSLEQPRRGYENAPWLAKARSGLVLEVPVTDPRTGKRGVLAAAPIPNRGFVLVVFYLDAVGPGLKRTYGGPRGLEFELAESSTVLARSSRTPIAGDALTATATVPNLNWRVTAAADRSEALASGDRLNRRELTIVLIGLTLVLLAAAVVHRRVARPIARLDSEVRRATSTGAPKPVAVTGPTEVRSLAHHMNQLGASLVREQAAYRTLFEGSPLPMWVHDVETRKILEANEAAVAAYGYTHEELLETTVDALERGPGLHQRKDGTTMEVSVASHPISFRGREACIVIAEDVTEKERMRLQLQQSQRLESLGQLAGGVAHDFNNLLAVILGYASFIERRAAEGSADERDVTAIREAGERATRLTRQLLAFARREVVRPTVLDLTGVVLEMEQLLRRTIGEHVVLETSLAPDLWPIMADDGQLEQVLINLAVNARDAMPQGGTLTIDTDNVHVDEAYTEARPGLQPGRYVRLRVSDTGVGMTKEVAERAFEPFFTTKPKGKGTGLGLATIHGIVSQAGGYAQIYSEPGLGTTFSVLLPATDAAIPEPLQRESSTAPGGGETILVVEDEPAMLEVTRRILDDNGYTVLTANRGTEAVKIAAEHDGPIDVLLTDVVMPYMLGKEVVERVGALRPGIRVLFMSGYAQNVIGPIGDLADGRQIIDKPFTEATLLGRLRAVLASPATP